MKMTFWTAESWIAACAALVREGVTFDAFEPGHGVTTWEINLTGGY